MIKFDNFSFSYGQLNNPQLKNFNFSIAPGEFVLLCGASACGKTTAAKCINGLIPHFTPGQFSGSVIVKGKKVSETPSYLMAEYTGSVFQNPKTQFFNLDSDSELVFGMENLCIQRDEMKRRLEKVTEDLDIGSLRSRKVFDLSGGEKQILALASVYAVNPDIYVLDEPTANIDEAGMIRLHSILKKLKDMGKTVVISEHRLYFLMDLVDKAVFIENGAVSEIFTGRQFRTLTEKQRIAMGLRCFNPPKHIMQRALSEKNGLLSVRKLSVKIGKHVLIKETSFSADIGDIIAVTGSNASGKTAFLRTLCGLIPEAGGSVFYDGKPVPFKKRRELCAMTMQDVAHQLFADSVRAEFGLLNADVSEEKIDAVLEKLNLTEYMNRHPMTLSGGQKQRLSIAAAAVSGKQIMIFDEPTSGLDYGNMCKVSELIKEISKDKIVFIASHDRELINMLCTEELQICNREAIMYELINN